MSGSRTEQHADVEATDEAETAVDPNTGTSRDVGLAEEVRVLAAIEGRSEGAVVREALASHVQRRRDDPAFKRLLLETRARHEALLRDFEARDATR